MAGRSGHSNGTFPIQGSPIPMRRVLSLITNGMTIQVLIEKWRDESDWYPENGFSSDEEDEDVSTNSTNVDEDENCP